MADYDNTNKGIIRAPQPETVKNQYQSFRSSCRQLASPEPLAAGQIQPNAIFFERNVRRDRHGEPALEWRVVVLGAGFCQIRLWHSDWFKFFLCDKCLIFR